MSVNNINSGLPVNTFGNSPVTNKGSNKQKVREESKLEFANVVRRDNEERGSSTLQKKKVEEKKSSKKEDGDVRRRVFREDDDFGCRVMFLFKIEVGKGEKDKKVEEKKSSNEDDNFLGRTVGGSYKLRKSKFSKPDAPYTLEKKEDRKVGE